MTRWQSDYAADCKSVYFGLIPERVSTISVQFSWIEHQLAELKITGSNPVTDTIGTVAQWLEHWAFNPGVVEFDSHRSHQLTIRETFMIQHHITFFEFHLQLFENPQKISMKLKSIKPKKVYLLLRNILRFVKNFQEKNWVRNSIGRVAGS